MRQRVLQDRFVVLRYLIAPTLALLLGSSSALAQSGAPANQNQTGKPTAGAADAAKDNQRKTDEFAEAAQAINGPAGNPECVWRGRGVFALVWRSDRAH